MTKMLIIYRLYDSSYGPQGNSKTLSVYLREDKTLGYSYYGGWQDSGMGFSISNMQLRESLPISSSQFKTTKKLHEAIVSILRTGVGSNKISKFEILNEIKEKEKMFDYQLVTSNNKWVGGGIQSTLKAIKQDVKDTQERLKSEGEEDTVVVFYAPKLEQFEVK
jgi:hypothetical protein